MIERAGKAIKTGQTVAKDLKEAVCKIKTEMYGEYHQKRAYGTESNENSKHKKYTTYKMKKKSISWN